ncbi:MAG: hypothetical protein PHU25_06010 [Deltaproteobacteria bacterium]|nr:hypothetical protein [Deltaproteobacteria bacterium]
MLKRIVTVVAFSILAPVALAAQETAPAPVPEPGPQGAEPAAVEAAPVCPPVPAKETKRRDLAKAHFGEGQRLSYEGDVEPAMAEFLCSLKMKEHPNTVYNVQQLARLSKNRQATIATLEAFLAENPASGAAVDIQTIVTSLKNEIAAEERAAEEARRAAEQTRLEAEAAAAEAARTPPPPPPKRHKEPKKDLGLFERQTTIYILWGAGGAAAFTGIVLQGLAGAAKSDAEDAKSFTGFKDSRDSMRDFQVGAIVGFAAAAVLGGAGLTLFLLDDTEEETQVALVPRSGGLGLEGSF